jgi:hypothetical protein
VSLSKDDLLQLMAYADGELDEGEIPGVLALLEKSDEARRILEQHSAVGEWVRASGEEHAVAARADDIAGNVMDRIAQLRGANVTPLDSRTKSARTRERVMAFGVVCAAAAAVSLFYLWPFARPATTERGPAAGSTESAPLASGSSVPAAPIQVAAAEPEGEGTDVQAVESPNHPVSIFYMPAATGPNAHASSVVVWIGEE